MLLERHAALLERGLREVEVIDAEHGGAAVRRVAVARAVEPDVDRSRLELGPLVAVPHAQRQPELLPVEANRPIHVGHPEPHVVDSLELHPPAPSSFASTITAAEVEGTARADCATAT
mgnify:CR=1 FL=1